MNSVFNLASHNFNQLTDDVAAAQEETKDAKEALKKLDKDTIEGLNKLDDKLGHFASDLEKVSDTILESEGKILLPDGTLIDDLDLDEDSPDDQIVVSRRQLDAIRARIDKIGYAISNLETGDFFPDRPSI